MKMFRFGASLLLKPSATGHLAKRFRLSRKGGVAVILALMLPVLIGMLALAVDMSRVANLQTEMQDVADAAALAGATQLDLSSGSRLRAIQAAANAATRIIENSQRYGDSYEAVVTMDSVAVDSGGVISTANIKFLVDLVTRVEPDDDSLANFIEVTLDQRTTTYLFAGIVSDRLFGQASGVAVAGYEELICGIQPMFICNPTPNGTDPFNANDYIGAGVTMKGNTGNDLVSGDFGFLQINDSNQNAVVCEALASANPDSICLGTELNGKPGQVTPFGECINVRFDIWSESGGLANSSWISDPDYPPAPNVTTGLQRNDLTHTDFNVTGVGGDGYARPDDADGIAPVYSGPTSPITDTTTNYANYVTSKINFPRDLCAYNGGGCDIDASQPPVGDGFWDMETYARVNHGITADELGNAVSGVLDVNGVPVYDKSPFWDLSYDPTSLGDADNLPGNGITRNEVYNWEVGEGIIPTAPSEYSGGPPLDGRRLLTVAVIDCPDAPNNKKNMPAAEPHGAIDIFLTEPMGGYQENNFYAEIIGPAGNNALAPAVARRRVVLYE